LNGDQIATRHKSQAQRDSKNHGHWPPAERSDLFKGGLQTQAGASDFVKSKAKPGPSVVIKAGIKEVSNH
jgi:hypothetical protein